VILQLKALGIEDVINFEYIERPSTESSEYFDSFVESNTDTVPAVARALELLYLLGALTTEGKLSAVGKQMSELPLEPMYSKVLLMSKASELHATTVTNLHSPTELQLHSRDTEHHQHAIRRDRQHLLLSQGQTQAG
jgi:HrpA-like RNA helicase